jgi:Mlc titration factor MtfA (ptsG expression regulator)
MPSRNELIATMWGLVEELYLEPRAPMAINAYAAASDAETRAILTEFAKTQAVTSQRWASIVQNLLSADLKP